MDKNLSKIFDDMELTEKEVDDFRPEVIVNYPENLLDLSQKEIVERVILNEDDLKYGVSANVKYHILNRLAEALGLELNHEMALMILNDPQFKLTIACAGAGKTTAAYLLIVYLKSMEKVYDALASAKGEERKKLAGANIKFLVYNNHNVRQVEKEHEDAITRVNMSNLELQYKGQKIKLFLDLGLSVSTFHSMARVRVIEHEKELGINGFRLIESAKPFEKIMSTSAAKFIEPSQLRHYRPQDLYSVYTIMKENLIDYNNLPEDVEERIPQLAKSKWDYDVLAQVYRGFEKLKDRRKYLDFTDYLEMFYKLLSGERYEDAKWRIVNRYDYYIVDEYQDFNTIMVESMREITKDNRMMVIGDDDQGIYGFRGIDIKEFLDFRNLYDTGNPDDTHIYRMSINRRCANNIVEAANTIVAQNKLRYPKSIIGMRDGGEVNFQPYSTQVGQARSIAKRLSMMSEEERNDMIICYKNNQQSEIIGYELDRVGIKYHIGNGQYPLNNFIFTQFYNCLQMMIFPSDRVYRRYISMITRIPMDIANNLVGWDNYRKEFSSARLEEKSIHFMEEDYGKFNANELLQEELHNLNEVSKMMGSNVPMKEYVGYLIDQFIYHSVNWRAKAEDADEEYFQYFTQALKDYYMSDLPWRDFYKQHHMRMDANRAANENSTGPLLSTFHGLKGLQASIVIVTGMDEEIYPAIAKIQQSDFPQSVETLMIEEERRLFYVLTTRAKEKVYFYYQQDNPSSFVLDLMESQNK